MSFLSFAILAASMWGTVSAGWKKGVATNKMTSADASALKSAGATWYQNWGTSGSSSHLHFHPTIWGREQLGRLGSLQKHSVLFGFNEPNMDHSKGGSAMSVGECAKDWPEVEGAAKRIGATTLVAPQLAWLKDSVQWYDKFFAECNGCHHRLQGVSAHYYNCDLPSLKAFVGLFKKFGKKLWITEMACMNGDACKFMKEAFRYLDGEPSVAGYAWFSQGKNTLSNGGKLTALGYCFKSAGFAENETAIENETAVVV